LEGVYTGVHQEQSKELAETLQRKLFADLRRRNPALEDRGVKRAPFVVLIATQMPGVLAEISCISNSEEAQLLRNPEYRQSIACALAAGVRSFAEGKNRPTQFPQHPSPSREKRGETDS